MPHNVIAELIRTRADIDDSLADQDLVVCLAANEPELLGRRPDLAAWSRVETQHLDPAIVLFLPASSDSPLCVRDVVAPVDRNVGGR